MYDISNKMSSRLSRDANVNYKNTGDSGKEVISGKVTQKYYLIHICTGSNIIVAIERFEYKMQKIPC